LSGGRKEKKGVPEDKLSFREHAGGDSSLVDVTPGQLDSRSMGVMVRLPYSSLKGVSYKWGLRELSD